MNRQQRKEEQPKPIQEETYRLHNLMRYAEDVPLSVLLAAARKIEQEKTQGVKCFQIA